MESLAITVRRLRTRAGLTQEELAEAAGISARSISDIERGLRGRVYGDTARRIADALRLEAEVRAAFLRQARGEGRSLTIHRPPAPLSPLVGRQCELDDVVDAVRRTRLVTLTGIGGIGKTRLGIATCERLASGFHLARVEYGA